MLKCSTFLLILSCITASYAEEDLYVYSDERRLIKNLVDTTTPDVRPVLNTSETLKVNFGIALIDILELDEVKGTMTTQVWMRMLWSDVTMRWKPDDFDGIDHVRIPIKYLWKPDIVLYNAAETGIAHYEDAMAVVSSDGSVLWIPPAILKSRCVMDLTRFPYDEQICTMRFGSWTFNGFQMDPDFYDGLAEMDMSDYISSNEWQVVAHPAKKNVKYYPCCVEPYPDLTFSLKLRRISTYHSMMYVAPIVLLAIICPVIFLLPYRETQRFSLGGSLLICLAILISNFEIVFPASHGSIPYVGRYYIAVVVLLTLSLIFSAIIVNLADKVFGVSHPPRFIKMIMLDILGRALLVPRESYQSLPDQDEKNPEGGAEVKEKRARQAGIMEWQAIAQALDRLFFIIYMILTIVLSAALLSHS